MYASDAGAAGGHKSLSGKLGAAKEKIAESPSLKEFEVTITETLQKKITVTARDRHEAEELAQHAWDDAEHILDAGHFTGVSFEASPTGRALPGRGEGR